MEEQTTKKLQLDRRKLLAIGISTLCVALVVAIILLFYPQKTAPIDRFCRALQKGSCIELQRCMPQAAWNSLCDKYEADAAHTNTFEEEMTQLVNETHLALHKQLGDKFKISFRVTDKKEYDNERLGKLAMLLSEKFGLDTDAVTEACELLVDTTSKGTDAKTVDENELYIVYKYHEEWYLYFDPLGGT